METLIAPGILSQALSNQAHSLVPSKIVQIAILSSLHKQRRIFLQHTGFTSRKITPNYRTHSGYNLDHHATPLIVCLIPELDLRWRSKSSKSGTNLSKAHVDARPTVLETRIVEKIGEVITKALVATGLCCILVCSAAIADTTDLSKLQSPASVVSVASTTPSTASYTISCSAGAGGATSIPVIHRVSGFPARRLLERVIHHLGGGGLAGAIGATVVYPLDTVKTRMQAQMKNEGEPSNYKHELECFWKLLKKEGVGSLYSGLLPQLIGIAPEKAMKLTVNEVLLEILENFMPGTGLWALELLAGGGGGFSQVIFTNPMEIVKVRLQTQAKTGVQKSSWDVVKELGLQGLYSGAGVTLARDIPSLSLFFACYAFLRQVYPENSFLDGCLAAIPATILSTPMDVIKTRLQMERAPGEEAYKDAWDCLWKLLQKEGHLALFSGGATRVLRISPQFGITLLIYDALCPRS